MRTTTTVREGDIFGVFFAPEELRQMSTALTLPGVPHATAVRIREKWGQEVAKRQNLLRRAKEEGGAMANTAVAVGTGAALGFAAGRYDRREVAGMPLNALVAAGAHISAFFLPRDKGSEMLVEALRSSGDAAAAIYAYQELETIGRDKKNEAG